jgi:hypothetical protein
VPVLSNQVERAVGLSWKPNNIGPYSALLDDLRSGRLQGAAVLVPG